MATKKAANSSDAVDAQLARYRSMRDFGVTAEPAGTTKVGTKASLPFCIQKHAASHLHYDFRLGWNGVLKSWACAKGPSYHVGDKRLAVQVEDHPIEYGGFEGIIPAGQYGGGTVMLWDQGTWEPQEGHTDVDAGLRDGNLKFVMHGTKMKGKWALIRMGGKAAHEKKPNWLLLKEHDEFEQPADAPAVTDEKNLSVVTGRTMEQIANLEDHVWNSKDTQKEGQAWYRRDASTGTPKALVEDAKPRAKKAAKAAAPKLDLKGLPKEKQPGFIQPQLAQQADTAPDGEGWLHELKLDGYRMQARKAGGKVQMLTRSGLDWTARLPSVAAAVAALPTETVTLDGEVVVLADDGTTNFADLQASFQDGAKHPLTYFVFDLLHLDGHNPRGLALRDRKAMLAEVLATADPVHLRFSEHLESGGQAMFHKACELRAEGILSKKASGKYMEGRSADWLKMKCLHEQEFVVGGYTLPSNGSAGIGALLLGYYAGKKLIYAGRSGTGFTQKSSKTIRVQLDGLATKETSFEKPPVEARRGAIWVRPELVAQIRFATWTADNQLRQAAFLGLREDKAASEVVRETSGPKPKRAKGSALPKASASHKAPVAKAALVLEKATVRLTHPEKVLDASSGVTKQMLADYFWTAAPRILPHIANRPLSLVRLPDGVGGEQFFQKHVTKMLPQGIGCVDVPNKKTGVMEPYITVDNREALASLAQMSTLEIHPWGSKNDDLERPDRFVIDLDPDESLAWTTVCEAAIEVRDFLSGLGLASFVKTTGGKGLHVVFGVVPELEWPQAKEFAHALVNKIEGQNPKLYLTRMTKSARVGKIYLDYLRNERGATAVAPYSTRARAGVGVAVPLDWSELAGGERPVFQLAQFATWSVRLESDPWAELGKKRQRITAKALAAVGVSR
ncbi:ATP-dependent DNA ligase LigD phosphoesterase module /ATP-dependent DNA ligase LigD polymerase module [Granulicella pectinivorans]|uniref:DNA ligase (ATP) n=1 Tax=Granulicella pectinivorans TaxID=474950 RepID=A0A1I6MHD0_9BACT|nr:DNA ligase D [Granulicella pectinivorans]SFS15115.1 ATP-dependent DNA ligase LigD phosphoesterase module /ATP-dependent DNA ligase LigD polymerase module [Granulicella pectinivorans]